MRESKTVVGQRPVLAVALVLGVSGIAFAGVSLAMRGTVQPLAVGLFSVVFAVVYLGFAVYGDTVVDSLGSR